MDIDEVIYRHGGIASFKTLNAAFPRTRIRAAVASGMVLRVGRGRYALPSVELAERAAHRLCGVLSHTSAALHHGWPVKTPPDQPHITVPRHRNLDASRCRRVQVHYADVERDGIATTPAQTVIDCARGLPRDEALAVADSALRSHLVGRAELLDAAHRAPRTGRAQAIAIVELADGRAANPFESVTRAVALEFPRLHLVPQVRIPGLGRPDLYDEELGLVVECDSFQFHATRGAVVRDVERYNACTQLSLELLRFAWEHIMLRQDYVREQFSGWLMTHRLAVRSRPTSR